MKKRFTEEQIAYALAQESASRSHERILDQRLTPFRLLSLILGLCLSGRGCRSRTP
jgi:hypothetical protein